MKGDKKIIDILNELLAGELTAVDQYLIHAEMYADMGFQRLADKALHESDHERQHARALIQRILFLEGTPNLAKREALKKMGRADLIGNGRHHLIPTFQPATDGSYQSARRKNSTPVGVKAAPNRPVAKAGAKSGAAPSGQKILVPGSRGQAAPAAKAPPKPGTILTQHTGLPPRATGAARRRPR